MERSKKGYILHLLIGVVYSIVCGMIVGAVVFFFKYIAKIIEHKSEEIYEISKNNVFYIILVFICLIAFACVMYLIHKKMPEAKGGGIPKSEGVLRGALSFNWIRSLFGTILGSMISYFTGVPVGTEGPSVLIGSSLGEMCSKVNKKHKALERYIDTGGAAAGFAVATGAPFSGILFALEEIHKRFTPMLVITVSISVISASLVNVALCDMFNISPNLFNFSIFSKFEYKHILYLLILSLLIAISVGLFDKSIIIVRKITSKYKDKFHPLLKLISLFIVTGILGYVFSDGIYSGHHIIEELIVNNKAVIYLIVILLIRLVMMHLVIDSSATGGIFIPTMAIAAIIGALIGKLLIILGLDPQYFPVVVVLSMIAFIGGTLRAPFTAAILFLELTGSFNNILYLIIVIFIVNLLVELFDQPSFYDQVLEKMEEDHHKDKVRHIDHFELKVSENSFVIGKAVRDIMWPNSLVIISIKRDHENLDKLDNDGERKLYANDTLIVRCRYYEEQKLIRQMQSLVGEKYEIKKLDM